MKERNYILGVDPGHKGALCLVDISVPRLVAYIDMPTAFTISGKRVINTEKLNVFLDLWGSSVNFALIEDVHSMPKQGVVSMFNFGEQKGILTGALSAFNIETRFVKPVVWKSGMGLSSDKNESRALAMELMPESRVFFIRARDEGRAEAALIALFGKRIA